MAWKREGARDGPRSATATIGVIFAGLAWCLCSCTHGESDEPDAGPRYPYPSISVHGDEYPDLVTTGVMRTWVAGLTRIDRIEMDGVSFSLTGLMPDRDFIDAFALDIWLENRFPPGYHTLRALGDGELTQVLPILDAGFPYWAHMTAAYRGLLYGECLGWVSVVDGARRVCLDPDGFKVDHFVRDPTDPVVATWTPTADGLATRRASYPAIAMSRPNAGADAVMVFFTSGAEEGTADIFAGHPGQWWPGESDLRRVATIPFDRWGGTVWHDENEDEYLMVVAGGWVLAYAWDAAAMSLAPDYVVVEGSGKVIYSTHGVDLDADGRDELVQVHEAGMEILRGDPVNGWTLVAEVIGAGGCSGTTRQQRPSTADLDGDGMLDVVATRAGGGVDVIYTNPDGTFDTRPNLLDPGCDTGQLAALSYAAAGLLDKERRPYVVLAHGHQEHGLLFRMTGRGTYVREDWRAATVRLSTWLSHNDLYDVDGDGCADLVQGGNRGSVYLWRRPAYEAEDGLYGPRPLRGISVDELLQRPAWRAAAKKRLTRDSVVNTREACTVCP
ncbi:MAG: VCBS repeat-containing protein [Deltaproteobacteria bacterium]|nr:VCBS repeat-containing protein [Deltaproteobacteria bacterium]